MLRSAFIGLNRLPRSRSGFEKQVRIRIADVALCILPALVACDGPQEDSRTCADQEQGANQAIPLTALCPKCRRGRRCGKMRHIPPRRLCDLRMRFAVLSLTLVALASYLSHLQHSLSSYARWLSLSCCAISSRPLLSARERRTQTGNHVCSCPYRCCCML